MTEPKRPLTPPKTEPKRPRLEVPTQFAVMQVPIMAEGRMIGWAKCDGIMSRWEIDEFVRSYLKYNCKFDPEWITETLSEEVFGLEELEDILEECIKYACEEGHKWSD